MRLSTTARSEFFSNSNLQNGWLMWSWVISRLCDSNGLFLQLGMTPTELQT